MIAVHTNGRGAEPLRRASLAEIETEVADVLDVIEAVQADADQAGPLWQIAEAVRRLAWTVGSLALHHADATAGMTRQTETDVAAVIHRRAA